MRILKKKLSVCVYSFAGLYLIFLLVIRITRLNQYGERLLKSEEKLNSSTFFVEIPDQGTFLYSAFIDNECYAQKQDDTIALENKPLVIIAWQNNISIKQRFSCCILTANNKTVAQEVIKTDHSGGSAMLFAIRFECLISKDFVDIIGVSIAIEGNGCSINEQHYINPNIRNSYLLKNKVAMCNDLLYGTVDPKLIIEWFEIHRFVGVDKFTIHQDRSLNVQARAVLQYYEHEGLLEILDFESPLKDTTAKRKYAETLPKAERRRESQQMWNDELLAIYDCRERHKFYGYAVDIDLDEILVPQTVEKNALKTCLADVFQKKSVAVLSFYVNLHFTSGKPIDANHPMLIGRYTDATQAVDDRVKNIYMPSRVVAGKGMIHELYPLEGFSREYIDPSIATLHHFHGCKSNSSFPVSAYVNGILERNLIKCDSFRKDNSTAIKQLSSTDILLRNINVVISQLEL